MIELEYPLVSVSTAVRRWPLWGRWFVAYAAICAVLCGYSIFGIQFIQWKLGTFEIWEPATGTTAYDKWLIEVPMYGMFWLVLAWTAVGIRWLFDTRRGDTVLLLATIWALFIATELAMAIVVWEPVSP